MFGDKRRRRERDAAVSRGRELLVEGDHQATFEFLEDAAERFPDDPEIRLLLASINLEYRPDEVASQALKAAELGAEDPLIQVRAGHLLVSRDAGAARACAKRARDLAESDFVLMAGLESLEGLLASLNGEDVLAEELLRSAVAREPEFSAYPVDLARFLSNRDRATDAIAAIDEALGRVREKDGLERMRRQIADEI